MQIIRFFKFILSNNFYQYFIILSIVIYFLYEYLVKEDIRTLYAYDRSYFNSLIKFPFFDKSILSYTSFALFCVFVVAYAFFNVIYSEFAEHFDELIIFSVIFKGGILKPTIWPGTGRFVPLGASYFNILIPISDKAYILHFLVFCQTLVLIFILYKIFDIFKVWQRFFLITLILFIPNIFLMQYSLIYTGRDIIFLFALFIFFCKKLYETNQSKYLWYALFVANISLYFKEVVFSLFVGWAFIRLLYYYLKKEFSLKDFFTKPLYIIKKYPMEFGLAFCSLVFIFSYLFKMKPWIYNAGYIYGLKKDLLSLLKVAFTDYIFISFILVLFYRAIYLIKNRNKFNLFWDSLAFGNLLFYLSYLFIGILAKNLSYYSPADFISVLYILYLLVDIDKTKLKAIFVILFLLVSYSFAQANISTFLYVKQKSVSWKKTVMFLKDYMNKNGSVNLYTGFFSWWPSVGLSHYLSYYKVNVSKHNANKLNDNYITLYNKDTTVYPDNKCWDQVNYICLKTDKINKGDLVLISPYNPNFLALFNEYNNKSDYNILFDSFNEFPSLLKFNNLVYRISVFVKK